MDDSHLDDVVEQNFAFDSIDDALSQETPSSSYRRKKRELEPENEEEPTEEEDEGDERVKTGSNILEHF